MYTIITMGKKSCRKICGHSYMKEHLRLLRPEQNRPDNATRKAIRKDCARKMCNPSCKNTFLKDNQTSFHPDFTQDEVEHLKSIGALSWCHAKSKQIGDIPAFDVMALTTAPDTGGRKKKKSKKKLQRLSRRRKKKMQR